MGFLQNYLGREPAYKDGCDLPLLGMMLRHKRDAIEGAAKEDEWTQHIANSRC